MDKYKALSRFAFACLDKPEFTSGFDSSTHSI